MEPRHQVLLQRAQALDRSHRNEEAAAAYQAFLELEPEHADTWADYAGILMVLGRLSEAEGACEAALRAAPGHVSARINLACIRMRQERLDEAAASFNLVLEQESQRLDARLALAECLLRRQELDKARAALEKALAQAGDKRYTNLASRHAELWAMLAGELLVANRFPATEEACRTALRLKPDCAAAQINLACAAMEQGRLKEGAAGLRRVVAAHADRLDARLALATCLGRMGEWAAAEQEIRLVIQREPGNASAHQQLNGLFYNQGRWADFEAELERFRRIDPASPYLEFEQGFRDLLFGEMPIGWDRYEARLRIPKLLGPPRPFTQPVWDGTPFPGKTLLLHGEQGFGDAIMFARYAPQVKALGGRVILETLPSLVDLMATCKGLDGVFPVGAELPDFDLQVSLLSLPRIFRTALASIPAEIPYLDVPERVPHRQVFTELLALAQRHGKARVGLVWAGNPEHKRDAERSIPEEALAPLAVIPDIAWFSLQKGRTGIPPLPDLVSLGPLLENFSDTACVLSGLDLLITVDTAVAHLAGALGIPTLLLLTFQPDFRWLLERDDSPWYPSLRLYRQPVPGDWDTVIQRLVADLTQEA